MRRARGRQYGRTVHGWARGEQGRRTVNRRACIARAGALHDRNAT